MKLKNLITILLMIIVVSVCTTITVSVVTLGKGWPLWFLVIMFVLKVDIDVLLDFLKPNNNKNNLSDEN